MITRRDALKIAAASAAAAPSTIAGVSHAQASRMLDKPAIERIPEQYDPIAIDPVKFADSVVHFAWDRMMTNECAEDYAAFCKAQAEIVARYPEFSEFSHPYNKMSDAIFALWNQAYIEGVRVGAAAEQFRTVLIGPKKTCKPCGGVGIIKNAACRKCNGAGTVPVALDIDKDDWRSQAL